MCVKKHTKGSLPVPLPTPWYTACTMPSTVAVDEEGTAWAEYSMRDTQMHEEVKPEFECNINVNI